MGYGFVWLFDDESSNGILTNIHIKDGKIVDTWHNEFVATNYADSDSFCINSQESIGSVKIENEEIITVIDSENISEKLEFSKKISDCKTSK